MNYAQVRHFDVANGIGVRSVLFVSGCTHHCKGCFNAEYQDFNYGKKWDKDIEDEMIRYIKEVQVAGVTILGGEPMQQLMDDDLLNFLKRIKREASNKSIWIYSGYTFEQIMSDAKKRSILKMCDILVDGPFIEEQKNIRLRFKGSENQRVIDVKRSLAEGKVVIDEELNK